MQSWTSTGYFSISTGSFITNCGLSQTYSHEATSRDSIVTQALMGSARSLLRVLRAFQFPCNDITILKKGGNTL